MMTDLRQAFANKAGELPASRTVALMIWAYNHACSRLYARVSKEDVLNGTPVQFVAVHPLRWHERDQPACGFNEAEPYGDEP